ncbi:MAG: carbohydrate-binding family 9-like protein, partial [Planctomycetes bacterium]|nr:carbohydrate-binding family 9-like protein [Planctomycetota bacterium]
MLYTIKKVPEAPALDSTLDGPDWQDVPALCIDNYHPEASDHRPETKAKAVYTEEAVFLLYSVRDKYVRSRYTEYLDPVYTDSCVEFFAQPKPDKGYFNFEFNAGGAFLVTYVIDPTRLP